MKRLFVLLLVFIFAGCQGKVETVPSTNDAPAETSKGTAVPTFSIASSEYPSWSTLMVAAKAGLINAEKGGKPGTLEEKWNVDVVLFVKDYDPCITAYANEAIDAVCITNIDCLAVSMSVPSTAILATSTSVGGDKIIAVDGIDSVEKLKGVSVYGLAKSVSQFLHQRMIEKYNLDAKDYPFLSLDPAAAATSLQTGSNSTKAIDVWNPFALETLRTSPSAKVVFDSSSIPEEIIDMIVVSNKALEKEGANRFACCLCDAFYQICDKLENADTKKTTLTALGEDFCKLSPEDMEICCKDTQFYKNPDSAIKLFSSPEFKKTMETVVATCKAIGIPDNSLKPVIGYNDKKSELNFSTVYMEEFKNSK